MIVKKELSFPFLPYAKQSINESDREAVAQALSDSVITRGERVEEFEAAMASYCGARYAVAFNSGSSALSAAYFATEISSFDRVISTPNTFIATIGGAFQHKASIQFIDIDRKTGNMDLVNIKKKIDDPLTRGRVCLVPVHFSGIAMDMQALDRLVSNPNTIVIEDAAHALGSVYPDGQRVGCCAWSHLAVLSFHPAKTLTTGEGGMVLTNDAHFYHRLQRYRNNGIEKDPLFLHHPAAEPGYYEVQAITGNFNFTDFQAALGLSQLTRLDHFIARRRHLMKVYREKLKNLEHVQLLTSEFDKRTAFHLCVVQIDFDAYGTTRETVMNHLKARGIGTQVHYIPLYRHPVLHKNIEEMAINYPEMERYYQQTLTLPLYYDLSEEDVKRVCRDLVRVLKNTRSSRS